MTSRINNILNRSVQFRFKNTRSIHPNIRHLVPDFTIEKAAGYLFLHAAPLLKEKRDTRISLGIFSSMRPKPHRNRGRFSSSVPAEFSMRSDSIP